MAVSVKLVERPSGAQIDQAVKLLVRAFEGDVSVDSMTGGDKGLRAPLFKSMLGACAVEGSLYVVVDDESEDILSLGAWFGPGKQMFSTEIQRDQGWTQFFGSLSENLQKWWMNTFLHIHEGELNKLLGDHYVNGWFANIIATDPQFQRRGYATSIVKAVFERATKESKAVSLATQSEENSLWYQKMGFKQVGVADIPADTGVWHDYFLLCEDPGANI